ncbi:PAS domain-containing protein [Sphingomonas sp. CLY1604]|uniref:PAS domain-containing protein n=1 Tax=Sphingomonas sp. CLY1604 TaxID=3457786 RepID=UPI003FD85D3F
MMKNVEPVGTIITNLEQQVLHIDDRAADIIGRERDTLIGQHALSFTHIDDLPANKPALNRLAVNGPGFTIVKRYVRGDGNLVWVKNHVTRVTDGIGPPIMCATTEPIERPFGNERLTRKHKAAQRLCNAMDAGRRQFSSEVVWAPAMEALVWLYRAEIEGLSLNADKLAALTVSSAIVMVRWVKLLQERGLVISEEPGRLCSQTCVRISLEGERKLDGLLSSLTP